MWKFTDGQTDDMWSEKLTWAKNYEGTKLYQVRNYTTNQLVWHKMTGVIIVQGTNWLGSCWHCHMTYVHVTNYPTTSCSLSCTILRSEVGYIFGSLYFAFHWVCSYACIFFLWLDDSFSCLTVECCWVAEFEAFQCTFIFHFLGVFPITDNLCYYRL